MPGRGNSNKSLFNGKLDNTDVWSCFIGKKDQSSLKELEC